MTQDELDVFADSCWEEHNGLNTFNHVKFAALVAAHVTEALTKSHEEAFQSYVDQAKADRELSVLAAVLAEREACAQLCEEGTALTAFQSKDCYRYAHNRAAVIRARGE